MIRLFQPPRAIVWLILFFGAGTTTFGAPFGGLERFYIGTYSGRIYLSTLDLGIPKFGATSSVGTDPSDPSFQPSFLALSPERKFLYSVDENNGTVLAYSINLTNGSLKFLNQLPSGGTTPAFITVDRNGSNVLVANYNGGNLNNGGTVAVFPILTNGFLGAATALIQDPGVSHAHCVVLDGNNHYAFIVDLGLDQVRCFVFDPVTGTLTNNAAFITSLPKGSGPRHLTFDPDFQRAYLICQNSSTIVGFNYDSTNGVLTPFQTNSTLPASGFSGNTTAEIVVHPSGKFLYGSNRGYNTVAVYQINGTNGAFTLVQQASTGTTPRHFAVDPTGGFCIVADQGSNDIRLYSINQVTGMLTYKSQIITSVSSPVCIVPFVWEPPQPVVSVALASPNAISLSLSNTSGIFTYQLYASPSISDSSGWQLVDPGVRGRTQFLRSNSLPEQFFRIGVLTNY